jgi:hypothetical protein
LRRPATMPDPEPGQEQPQRRSRQERRPRREDGEASPEPVAPEAPPLAD